MDRNAFIKYAKRHLQYFHIETYKLYQMEEGLIQNDEKIQFDLIKKYLLSKQKLIQSQLKHVIEEYDEKNGTNNFLINTIQYYLNSIISKFRF